MDSAVREMERRASPELRRAQTAREPALTFQGLGPAREPSKPLPAAYATLTQNMTQNIRTRGRTKSNMFDVLTGREAESDATAPTPWAVYDAGGAGLPSGSTLLPGWSLEVQRGLELYQFRSCVDESGRQGPRRSG
jgi:hypothetical protein